MEVGIYFCQRQMWECGPFGRQKEWWKSGGVDGDLSTEAYSLAGSQIDIMAEPPPESLHKKGGEMGVRVPVMGPNVRTYLFHPLAQVIGRLSVCPRLKRGVMYGGLDRG